jgi:hypothetical protein
MTLGAGAGPTLFRTMVTTLRRMRNGPRRLVLQPLQARRPGRARMVVDCHSLGVYTLVVQRLSLWSV